MLSFFAPDVLPREALAKEPSNKDFIKTGGLFKLGFLFDGVFKSSVICKKLPLPGGVPIEVDMAVLPEKILAQGINSEVVPVKDNMKIGVKFLHLMCCPERLWPRVLVTRFVKRQVVFLSQAFYF